MRKKKIEIMLIFLELGFVIFLWVFLLDLPMLIRNKFTCFCENNPYINLIVWTFVILGAIIIFQHLMLNREKR